MRRLTEKEKYFIQKRAWKSFRHKVRSRRKKRAKRRMLQGVPRNEIKQRNELAKYKHIRAPKCLSMIENPEGTLEFISLLEHSLHKREKVFVVLKDVDKIANGAIIVLLSIMIKFKKQKVGFNGDHPKNSNARQYLLASGFFEHLYEAPQGDKVTIRVHKSIFTHANKTVDSDLSDRIISKVSEMIWGEPKRCPGVQRTYLELMQNTNNHASLKGPNEHHWYTTVSYDKEKNKACFSFIDYGVGIIESINRNEKGKFWNSLSKIFSVLNPHDDGDFLRMLLDGRIHKTATGDYYRGKGLPGVYKAFSDNKISNLVIITNDAMADCQNNVFKTLKKKFVGTYIYWELNVDNKCLNYDNSINSKGL